MCQGILSAGLQNIGRTGNANAVRSGSSSTPSSSVVKKFSGKFCGQKFPQGGNVKRHEMTHTGEKPYSCRVCSKSFSQPQNRNRHEISMHGYERPARVSRAQQGRVSFGKSTKTMINLTGDQVYDYSNDVPIAVSVSASAGMVPKPMSINKELVQIEQEGNVHRKAFNRPTVDPSFNVDPKKLMPPPREHPPSKRMPVTKSIPITAYFRCEYCRAKFKDMANAKGHSAMCFKRFRIEKPSPVNFQFPTFPGFRNGKTNRSSSLLTSPLASRTTKISETIENKYGKTGISPRSVNKNQKTISPVGHHRCQYCSYSSKHLGHVKIHENIHTGAKPFKCLHCNFKTGNPGRLSEHRRANPGCAARGNQCKTVQEKRSASLNLR